MKSIIFCDLDGCLNFYPKTFLEWVNKHTGIYKKDVNSLKSILTKEKYEKLKYNYRTCGVKRNLPVRKGAINTLKEIKKSDKKIWIVTTRPTFEPVKRDTQYWLKKNKIIYDKLIFQEGEKKKEFIRRLRKRICFIIEDDLNIAIYFAGKLKIPVFLFDNKQLGSKQDSKKNHPLIIYIKSWNDIKTLFSNYI